MAKQTVITITFENEMSEKKRNTLIDTIIAQCSEDESGESWGAGDFSVFGDTEECDDKGN